MSRVMLDKSSRSDAAVHAVDLASAPTAAVRVLFFDYWTAGIEKFARLVPYWRGRADCRLLHFGSLRDRATPKFEVCEGIPCVDFSALKLRRLGELLGAFQPEVVVGLNIAGLLDRAVFSQCRRLGVPSVFLQHGMWYDSDLLEGAARAHDAQYYRASQYLRRVPAMARILPWYFRARPGPPYDLAPWKVILRNAVKPSSSHSFPIEPQELWPTRALVFTEEVRRILEKTHRLPSERITVVGNPELDAVIRQGAAVATPEARVQILARLGLDPARPVACYIEDGFPEQSGYLGWTQAVRAELLRELCEVTREVGLQLLIRPHPISVVDNVTSPVSGYGHVVVSRADTLVAQTAASDVVMGTLSTALETPVVLGKPVVIPEWHLRGHLELSPYLRHGAALATSTPAELAAVLSALCDGSRSGADTRRFQRERLGPVDGRATERAAHEILSLARPGLDLAAAQLS